MAITAPLYHLQINVDFAKNASFYRNFMSLLGWHTIFESSEMAGFGLEGSASIWFVGNGATEAMNYDLKGVNHISFKVPKLEDVDKVIDFLTESGIQTLFDTPRHRPEFSTSEKETYYQIIFETPDGLQVEVVYTGIK